ncbi:MAG: PhzF family phenazine biosynthesis protein [Halieaceae bacterium]
MKLDQYQVSAFTQQQFGGNPAAVVPLQEWLPRETMLAIAAENNLSETAFFLPEGDDFLLRWFTPQVEVELCGHATLATAHVLFNELGHSAQTIRFLTYSGELLVSQDERGICLDLPVHDISETSADAAIVTALGCEPLVAYAAPSWVYRYASEQQIRELSPDFRALLAATDLPVIVTAPGDQVDFVSRFFGPQVGIDEDPVTGSAHCALVPLWADRLGKQQFSARQLSARGGDLDCELLGQRVLLRGYGLTFLRGQIEFD